MARPIRTPATMSAMPTNSCSRPADGPAQLVGGLPPDGRAGRRRGAGDGRGAAARAAVGCVGSSSRRAGGAATRPDGAAGRARSDAGADELFAVLLLRRAPGGSCPAPRYQRGVDAARACGRLGQGLPGRPTAPRRRHRATTVEQRRRRPTARSPRTAPRRRRCRRWRTARCRGRRGRRRAVEDVVGVEGHGGGGERAARTALRRAGRRQLVADVHVRRTRWSPRRRRRTGRRPAARR